MKNRTENKKNKSSSWKKKGIKIFQGIYVIFLLILTVSCSSIKVRDYKLTEFEIQEPVRIVQVSDFHSNTFGKDESRLLKKIQDARPDLIFLTGDIYDFYVNVKKGKNLENYKALLSGIKEIAPFYYISGNHEYYFDHSGEWAYLIEEYGGKILADETVFVNLKQGTVEITGIGDPFEDMTYEERVASKDNKEAYLARLEKVSVKAEELKNQHIEKNGPVLFTVLLAHRPEYIKDYLKYGYDLIFSGHAHGGQWRFPPFINGIYAPGQGLFPKYAGGKYSFKDSKTVFIVNRGLSYQSTAIPRIFNPPELVVIEAGQQ